MVSLRRQLEEQNNVVDDYYSTNDAVTATNDDFTEVQDDDAAELTAAPSSSSSIRATNCISFTIEPKDDDFNAVIHKNKNTFSVPTSYMPGESFMFYSHHSDNTHIDNAEGYDGNQNFGKTYMIDVKDWVAAFGGGVASCQSLNEYREDIFANSNNVELSNLQNIYWGPICHHNNFGITMGVFLDDGCTIYAPELSKQLEDYLYYNENGNPDQDLMDDMYATAALNDYYQNDYDCNNDNGDICAAIFENSADEETCQRMNGSGGSSYSFTPITFTNWFQYRDPHNYYHLSQTDLRDLSSTCSAVNTALSSNRYNFEDILLTLEMENGDTAATLEQYNQEILSPMERLFATIGAVILAMIGIYCCIATTRRLQRAHRRATRKQQRGQRSPGQTNESKSIIYELGRTLTTASSDGASSGNGSKQEPLLDDESTDITNSSTKYPIASTSYSYQPRLEQANGNIILQQEQDQSLKIMSIVPENARSKKASKSGKAKTPRTKRPFLRWMQFGEKPDEDVFDGISISDSTTYEDPFVGITNDTKRSSDPKEKNDDNDSLFEDVGNN